jgi:predicted secreted Zn-dependent protease
MHAHEQGVAREPAGEVRSSTPGPGSSPSSGGLDAARIGYLQQTIGNAAVGRLLQRYKVPYGPDAECAEVVNWINTSGPYVKTSGAAQTKTPLKASWGQPKAEGTKPDFVVTVPDVKVKLEKPSVDMPEWNPSDPEVAKAWSAAMADLRTHEAEHEKKGQEYEKLAQDDLAKKSEQVTANSADEAIGKAKPKFQDAFKGWVDKLQAAHKSIDPYLAKITCPPKKTSQSAEGAEAEGTAGGTAGEAPATAESA